MNPRIISGLRAGEPGALGELFDAVGEELFQYCWLMVRGREAALAVVHDTIMVAQAHIGQLRDPGQARLWLYALARAVCQCYTPGAPGDAVPVLNATRDETSLMAWSAVMSLSPAEREMLDLTARRGMSASDAGLVTGLGIGAESLIDQAHASLQQAMSAEIAARRPGIAPGKVSPAKVYARLPWPALPPGTRAGIIACFTGKRQAQLASPGGPALPVPEVSELDRAVATTAPDGLPTLVSPARVAVRRRITAGLLAAAIAVGSTLVLAMAGLSLSGSTWSAPPVGSAVVAAGTPARDVAHAWNTRPMVARPAGPTGGAQVTPGFGYGPGPGPGTGNAAALYLAIVRPRPGPVPSSTSVLPPPTVPSPIPSGTGSPSPSGSASPSPSPGTSSTSPPPSVSPSASPSSPLASPSPPSASPAT